MKIKVHFYTGKKPLTLDAASAPDALKQVNDNGAYVVIVQPGGYEVIRYSSSEERFHFSAGRTVAQAVENLFTEAV